MKAAKHHRELTKEEKKLYWILVGTILTYYAGLLGYVVYTSPDYQGARNPSIFMLALILPGFIGGILQLVKFYQVKRNIRLKVISLELLIGFIIILFIGSRNNIRWPVRAGIVVLYAVLFNYYYLKMLYAHRLLKDKDESKKEEAVQAGQLKPAKYYWELTKEEKKLYRILQWVNVFFYGFAGSFATYMSPATRMQDGPKNIVTFTVLIAPFVIGVILQIMKYPLIKRSIRNKVFFLEMLIFVLIAIFISSNKNIPWIIKIGIILLDAVLFYYYQIKMLYAHKLLKDEK